MKKAKIFGRSIPVLAIVAIVMVAGMGLAAASYLVWDYKFETTVPEPISVEVIKELSDTIDPGGSATAIYKIHNSGTHPMPVTVTWRQLGYEESTTGIVTCATAYYIDADGTTLDDIFRESYNGTETFILHPVGGMPSSCAIVQVRVQTFRDTPPGDIDVPVTVSRG